jgi:hypothetical protein
MDRLAEAIFVAGGPVTNDSCPEFISESELAIINKWFFVWKKCFVQIFRRYSFNGDVEIALTPSPDFSCRVFPLEESKFLILIPLGVAARVKVLARLLHQETIYLFLTIKFLGFSHRSSWTSQTLRVFGKILMNLIEQ